MMTNHCVLDALENVLIKELPENLLPDVLLAQAELLAGASLDSLN